MPPPQLNPKLRESLYACVPEVISEIEKLIGEIGDALQTAGALTDELASRDAKLHSDINRALALSGAKADAALADMDPSLALHADEIGRYCASEPKLAVLPFVAGVNKFLWAAAVAGGGTARDTTHVWSYLEPAAEWCALRCCASLLADVDDELPWMIANNPNAERMRRHLPMEIRFTWISRLIFEQAAQAVHSDPIRYEKLKVLSNSAVTELFDYLCSSAWGASLEEVFPGLLDFHLALGR